MIELSCIVATNDSQKLQNMLLNSLENQNFSDYELIVEDGRRFNSAGEAYHAGAQRAKGKFFLFLHHDIVFTSKNSLEKIAGYTKFLNDQYTILGFAGAKQGTTGG